MSKKRKPHEERKPEDCMEAADNALGLAKVLANDLETTLEQLMAIAGKLRG